MSKKNKTPKATKTKTKKKTRVESVTALDGPTPEQAEMAAEAIGYAPSNVGPPNADALLEASEADLHKLAKRATKTKAPKEPKPKKISGLDAAAQVLADAGKPMTCKEIVDEMLAKGMWKTSGKTPSATIYSAMLREIDTKPGDSRFKKTDRGLFARA